ASHQRLGAGDERAPRGASISSGDGGIGNTHNVPSMTAKRSRKRVASVREYVASKPKESRASLEAVRRAILKALPNAQEGLAYQMPAYTLNGRNTSRVGNSSAMPSSTRRNTHPAWIRRMRTATRSLF